MSEFQTKVEQFKQSFNEPGFTVGEEPEPASEEARISTDEPSIGPTEQPEVTPSPKQKFSKRRVDGLRSRVDQLTYENKIREAQNQELLARVRAQEQLLAEKQDALEQNEQYKNAYYENNLQTREAAIINELKAAKEDGDVDKEIGLSKALSQVTAEQATYGLYKSQLRNQNSYNTEYSQNPDYYPQTQYPQPNTVDYGEPADEHLENWLENNSWANQNSPTFSPKLYQEVNDLASELNETLKYNGYAAMIGTPEYYASLDNLMADRYSVKRPQEREEPQASSSYNNSSMVAPVSRSGSSLSDRYIANNPNNTRKSTSLTDEEFKIARNLQIKLPNGRWANSNEAIKRYAEAKRFTNNDGSNKLIIE